MILKLHGAFLLSRIPAKDLDLQRRPSQVGHLFTYTKLSFSRDSYAMLRTTERLIPNVVKRLAAQNQHYATIVDADGKQQHLSYQDLDNASSRAAWFINQNLQGQDKFFYMGPNDIRYVVWVLAAMKTRKCVSCAVSFDNH